MRVGVIGINHKLAHLQLRETIARVCQRRFGPGYSLHDDHAFVLLSTCNRMELYFSSEDLTETHSYILQLLKQEIEEPFDQKLYSYFGEECFTHLTTVAAGLDSAVIAETEIQGQVKKAYEAALNYSRLPPPMHYLFQKSLRIAKSIRSSNHFEKGIPELEHAIYQTGMHLFKQPSDPKILVVGASEINIKILDYLNRRGRKSITLCNRTDSKAVEIAARFDIDTLSWHALNLWTNYDWIILGTKATQYLIGKDALKASENSKKLIIDLSFPRNADPLLARSKQIQLLNIDQINRVLKCQQRSMSSALQNALMQIESMTKLHADLYLKKQASPWKVCHVA